MIFSTISNPLLFVILCTILLPFPPGCCVTQRRAKTAGKTWKKTDFHTNLNPLEDISSPPCCDVTLLFRTFPKVGKLWTGDVTMAELIRRSKLLSSLPTTDFLESFYIAYIPQVMPHSLPQTHSVFYGLNARLVSMYNTSCSDRYEGQIEC